MPRRAKAGDFPHQEIYSFAATSRLLGVHVTTLYRWAKAGQLKTVDTPSGRRINREEIQRQSSEAADAPSGRQAGEMAPKRVQPVDTTLHTRW